MEHDAQNSRLYKENWEDAVQASNADAAEIAELKEAYALLFKDNALLRQVHADFRRECGDTDAILRVLGLDPVNCRTDGGSLKLAMISGALEHRDLMLKREARKAAKGLTVQADSDGTWLAFASSTGLHALLNVEHIAESYGGIVSKAIRDWAADASAAACPSGKCTDPARDCYGSGCLSDEPQSAVAAAYGGLTQTAQG